MARSTTNQPPRHGPEVRVAKAPKGAMKIVRRLIHYVTSHYRFSLLVVMGCIVVTAVATLSSTLFTRTLIDDYILPLTQTSNPEFGELAQALIKLGVLLIVGIICSYASNMVMIFVSNGTLKRLRLDVFRHMESLPLKYFDTHPHGDIMSVYTNDIDTLNQMISRSLPQVFNSLITFTMTLVSMIVLSIPLTCVSILLSILMVIVTRYLGELSMNYFSSQQTNLGALNGYVEEMVTGQKVVKTFCHEKEAIAEFDKLSEALRDSTCNANKVANIVMPVNGNLGNLGYVLCAVVGAFLALSGHFSLTIGTLVSYLTLSKNFNQTVSQVSQQINSVIMAVAGAGRVFALLDEAPENDNKGIVRLVNVIENEDNTLTETTRRSGRWGWKRPRPDGTYALTLQQGGVRFYDVDFSYVPDKQVLFDICMDAKPGMKIALVGGTGAGKTTITNLINRFYDIQDGKIQYDNININFIHRADLRRSLGMVLQETHLFTGTVMDNIRYGRLDATDEDCIAAAKLVNADDFIRRLKDGYQTMLTGDGSNLSQGERQLLAIARAAVANPPALILDEATSSIDTRTETLVQRGMDQLMKGRTTFVIAHRLSTVQNADLIMVMEKGRIIEQGSHDELLALGKKYYQLYTGNQID